MSGNSSNYGPTDDTPSELLLEKTFLTSGYLTGVGYGIQFVLYLACVHILWKRDRRSRLTKMLIPYLTILCIMNTIWTTTSAYGLQLTFIDNRNYPGSVIGFLDIEFALTPNVVSLASYITGNFMADMLMVWRCYMVWTASPSSKAKYAIVLPCLMLIASLVLAILFGLQTTGPSGLFGSSTAAFATPYFAVSMILNIIVTILIVVRILFYRRTGVIISGASNLSTIAIFIESAALYSIISLLLLVTFALGHPINQIWLGIAPSVQVIANYIIVYHVARGQALGAHFTQEEESASDSDMTGDVVKNELSV
ncbi:hypothetical protein B0H13DRAFT_1053555 [Mycena leptocephala]|nr:hypothetical protein B0H13DRAFT_1053555 [Mycena leptocephala]